MSLTLKWQRWENIEMENMRNDYEMVNEIWNDESRCETWMNSSIDQRYESCHWMSWCIQMLNEMSLIYTYIIEHVKILVDVNKEWAKIILLNWNTWT